MADKQNRGDRGKNEGQDDEVLRAVSARVRRDGDRLKIEIDLTNPSDRTLHVVSEMRGMRYDAATRTLTVLLNDEGFQLSPGALWKLPRTRSVESNGEATLEVRIPATMTRLVEGNDSPAPGVETIDLTTEVAEVEVEVAWGRTPLYRDVRETAGEAPPIELWRAGTARVETSMRRT